MQLQMFSVRDKTASFHFPPFFLRSIVEATRAFERVMADPNRSGAASEYDLVFHGEFDDQTGTYTSHETRIIANGKDVIRGEGA